MMSMNASPSVCRLYEAGGGRGPGFGRRPASSTKKSFLDWYFNSRASGPKPPTALARTTPMRIEPKTFFANERTFLSWLHMAITIGSIAAALLGFSGAVEGSTAKKVPSWPPLHLNPRNSCAFL